MKKTLGIIVLCLALVLAFAACGGETKTTDAKTTTAAAATTAAPSGSGAPTTTAAPGGEHVHTIEVLPAEEATCYYEGLTEGQICTECGETLVAQEVVEILPHTTGEFLASSNGYHFRECEVCGEQVEVADHEAGCEVCGITGYLCGGDQGQEAVAYFSASGTITAKPQCLYLNKIDGDSAEGTYTLMIDIPEEYTKAGDTCLFICRGDVGTKHYDTTEDVSTNGGPYYFIRLNNPTVSCVGAFNNPDTGNPWNYNPAGGIPSVSGEAAEMVPGEYTIICDYSVDPVTGEGAMSVTTINANGETKNRTVKTTAGALNGLYYGFRNVSDASIKIIDLSFEAK